MRRYTVEINRVMRYTVEVYAEDCDEAEKVVQNKILFDRDELVDEIEHTEIDDELEVVGVEFA